MINMNITKKEYKKNMNLEFILAILIIAWLITPIVSAIPFYRSYIMISLFVFWLIVVQFNDNNFIFTIIKKNILLIIFTLIIVLFTLISRGSQTFPKIFQFIYLFIFIALYFRYFKHKNLYFKTFITRFFIASFILTSLITNYVLLTDPLYAKLISTADSNLANNGVGGFHFIYALVALTVILVIRIRITKKNLMRNLLLIGFFGFTVVNTQYLTAIILMFVFIFLSLIMDYRVKNLILILLIFTATLYLNLLPIIIDLTSPFISNAYVSGRLNDVSQFMSGVSLDYNSSFGNRVKDLQISFETFFQHPFIGVGAYYGIDHIEHGIGNHSQWIDDLARYGIFISLILFSFIGNTYKIFLKNSSTKTYIRFGLFYFIILGILNPVFGNELNGVLFLFIPLISLERGSTLV